MASLISRFDRKGFGRIVMVAGLLVTFGCGESGSGPGVAPPPTKGTEASVNTPTKPGAPTGKKTKAKTQEPTGAL